MGDYTLAEELTLREINKNLKIPKPETYERRCPNCSLLTKVYKNYKGFFCTSCNEYTPL